MVNKFYTYAYLDPRKSGIFNYKGIIFEYEPFYVGKGSGRRLYEHLRLVEKDSYNQHKVNRIKCIQRENKSQPIIIKIKKNLTEQDRRYINRVHQIFELT